VAAGTPVGLEAKAIMESGGLVPNEVVVGIVADRIEEADARNGFILDGFPRTVEQAAALDRMLDEKNLKLDTVVELAVDEDALVGRIAKRASETAARGEPVRKDDTPEVFKTRLEAYRAQTAPLSAYYASLGMLETLDGMQPIDTVTAKIMTTLERYAATAAS
jgi:adenylate kinase